MSDAVVHPRRSTRTLAVASCLAFVIATMAGLGQVATARSATAEAPAGPSVPGDWVLVWSDEFDGPAGTGPDPQVWGHELGDGAVNGLVGWGNNELQWYTDEPENVALDGEGHLVISALEATGEQECYYGPCQYTSARLLTKDRFDFQHGYLEARLRVPPGFGLWPAFWLLGSTSALVTS